MTSFTSLLQSIGGQKQNQSPATASRPTTDVSKALGSASVATKPAASANGTARLAPNNAVAGIKRKSEDQPALASHPKVVRTEVKVPLRPTGSDGASVKPAPPSSSSAGPYRGTARPSAPSIVARPSNKPAPSSSSAPTAAVNGAVPKPKRGFSSILEKAKAAQEAAKAAGVNTIKHKPVEKLTKRERLKLQEEAKQRAASKGGKAGLSDRSRSGTSSDGKAGLAKQGPESGYKGTMKKAAVQPQSSYKGTMKRAEPGAALTKPATKKGMGQDKYGGYASWSDLSAAEEDEEDYESEGSDDMDAGFDDMEREETMALKVARKEDQEALEEEERLKREKLERKRKLQALSKSAAARKKF